MDIPTQKTGTIWWIRSFGFHGEEEPLCALTTNKFLADEIKNFPEVSVKEFSGNVIDNEEEFQVLYQKLLRTIALSKLSEEDKVLLGVA